MRRMRILSIMCLLGALVSCARDIDQSFYTIPRKHTKDLGKRLAKEHDLYFLSEGGHELIREIVPHKVSDEGESIEVVAGHALWVLNFVSDRELTLEEVEPIARKLAASFWDEVRTNPAYAYYHEHRRRQSPAYRCYLDSNQIGFRLAFWDENMERPTYPYIAQVKLIDGHLLYHYAEGKLGALKPPKVEVAL